MEDDNEPLTLPEEVEIAFAIWMSNVHDVAKQLHKQGISWEVLTEMLKRAHMAGVGAGMIYATEKMEGKRK